MAEQKAGAGQKWTARVKNHAIVADWPTWLGVASPALTLCFWAGLLALCGLRAYAGLYGTRVYSHDAFMVIDGAWRMLHGQRPHADFNSMIGPVAYLPVLVGLLLSGMTASGFGYGLALAGFALGGWAFALSDGFAPWLRVGYAWLVAGITMSPAMVGPTPFAISPGMTYNRVTYGLLALLLAECLLPEGRRSFLRGFSTGAVLGLLTFTKMTGLVAGSLLIAAFALVAAPKSRRRWAGLAGGVVAVLLGCLAYLRFKVGLVLNDLALTAAAKHIAIADRYDLNTIFFEAGMTLAVVFAVVLWLRQEGRPIEARRLGLAAVVTAAVSVLLIFGNFQRSELPLSAFLILIAVNEYARARRAPQQALMSVGMAAAAVYLLSAAFALLFGFGVAVYSRLGQARHATRFVTPALWSFVPVGENRFYTYNVNDGLELLEAHRLPGERVMSLDFTNPFSFGLGIPPAPGGSTNLQFHGSFDLQHHMPAEALFGAAQLVMEPLQEEDPGLLDGIQQVYAPYLHQHYALVAATHLWRLYRRQD